MRGAAIFAAALLAAGCAGRRLPPPAPEHALADAARELAAGRIDAAIQLVHDVRAQPRPLPEVARWSALLASMTWRDDEAIADLRMALRAAPNDGALHGQLGDLLFQVGRFRESVDPLSRGARFGEGERRAAFAAIALLLPPERRPSGPLVVEQPLLAGDAPEFVCSTNGRRRPFAIDTGTSMTTLGVSFAAELGVRALRPAGQALDGAGRPLPVQVGVLDRFALGDVALGDTPVLVVDDAALRLRDLFGGPERVPRGVLGLDVLSSVRLTIDPERGSVVIEPARGLPEARSVQCVRVDGRCLVPVVVDGAHLWFVLDTGASHSSLSEAGLLALPGGTSRAQATYRRVRTVGGSVIAVREVRDLVLRCHEAKCLGVTMPVVPRGSSTVFPMHGVLGLDVLRQCVLTLDRGRLRLVAR